MHANRALVVSLSGVASSCPPRTANEGVDNSSVKGARALALPTVQQDHAYQCVHSNRLSPIGISTAPCSGTDTKRLPRHVSAQNLDPPRGRATYIEANQSSISALMRAARSPSGGVELRHRSNTSLARSRGTSKLRSVCRSRNRSPYHTVIVRYVSLRPGGRGSASNNRSASSKVSCSASEEGGRNALLVAAAAPIKPMDLQMRLPRPVRSAYPAWTRSKNPPSTMWLRNGSSSDWAAANIEAASPSDLF